MKSKAKAAERRAGKPAGAVLLVNIGQLVTMHAEGKVASGPRRGAEMRDIGLIEDAAVLCVAGKIVSVGKTKDAVADAWVKKYRLQIEEMDCAGKVVLPGFVDAHTHPVFTAPRLVDFEKRIAGATYEEIAVAGGGIRSSVEGVRKASQATLAEAVLAALEEMRTHGTTTVEAKSGYGLSVEAELKSLQAIADAASRWSGTVVPTLLGAHVVPRESLRKPEAYVRDVCEKMIPQAAKKELASFVDVFIERGAFTLDQAERVFEAARKHGLGLRAHVCQMSADEVWPLLRFKPASLDHLDHVSGEDVAQLARSGTVATLVPGANYFLNTGQYPPARKLIDAGVPVALATDYNPGTSPTPSMPMAMSLACTQMKMSPEEALTAATINGAWSLGLAARKGSVEPGKDADLAIFDIGDYREVAYWFGGNRCVGVVASALSSRPR
jgi:imidazolonepropionase